MRYCGYSEFMHDSGLAFISVDGDILYASHGERYSKVKNDPNLPSIMYDMIFPTDHVTFYENPEIRLKIKGYKGDHLSKQSHIANVIYESIDYDEFIEHHVSHAANGFYTRPWESVEDTVILSIDGAGETDSMVLFNHKFDIIDKWVLPRSLGYFYAEATKLLGYRALEEEYIVMGMAAYGQPTRGQELIDFFYSITADGHYTEITANTRKFNFKKWMATIFEQCSNEDFAASIQYLAEHVIMEQAKFARKFGSKLIFTGGCAQNIVACSKIRPLFDDMHVPIAPTDSGSALGAAAYSYAKANNKDRINWEGPYLGHNIDREINPKEVVEHLIKHSYCGVANGRAEFGPRALGNRSLIADVRSDIKDTVNSIKRRQKFRPFAPAILEEYADQYFSGPMNEYMQYTSKALHDYKSVIHVDGTSRVQVVKKDCKSIIRPILEEFYEKTGVPMLLNTSLNIRGMPIVNDIKDANAFQEKYGVKVF
jgi:carbamoyltransferase